MADIDKLAKNGKLRYDPDGPAQQFIFDGKLHGFGIQLNANERHSYIVRGDIKHRTGTYTSRTR